jgi:pyruvate,water dikinase
MDDYVITLKDIRLNDAPLVGNKAAVLGALYDAGFPVPDGFCITTHAFQLALDPYLKQIEKVLSGYNFLDPKESIAASENIASLLINLVVPTEIINCLNLELSKITDFDTPLAVRSSATAEDTPDASFAGHYESVLGVCGEDAIQAAILDVWRSYFNPEALGQRYRQHNEGNRSTMAVLILPVVEAECSGVVFSVDPVGNRKDRVVINATWGLGLGVVDGSVGADTAWVNREGVAEGFEIEEYRVGEKINQYGLNPAGGLCKNALTADRHYIPCLPDSWLIRVAQFCVAAEVLFGQPQDMEWAIANDRFWVLQSRPMTTLPGDWRHPTEFPVTWDNPSEKQISWNHYSYWRHVLKPLEMDYAKDREDGSREASYFTGGKHIWRAKIVNGRVYDAWVLSDQPEGHRRIRRELMKDLGVRLHRQGKTTWDYWGPEIESATARLNGFNYNNATDSQIADHLENARGVCHRHWSIHGFRLWITNQPHQAAFKTLLGISDSELIELTDRIFEGEPNPSTHLIDGLYELAQKANEIPKVGLLISNPPENVLEVLENLPEAEDFLKKYVDFVDLYGARTGLGYGSDGTIITRTWKEQPSLLLSMVSQYLNQDAPNPDTIRRRAQEKRDNQLKGLIESCADKVKRTALEREVDFGRRQAAIMEIHNHYIDQMMNGQLRHGILGAAERLVRKGILKTGEDIFWLHFDEIDKGLRSDQEISFKKKISARKKRHMEWEKLDPPPLIGTPEARLPERPHLESIPQKSEIQDDSKIRGIGASPGRYHGRAKLVPNSVLLPDLEPGEILVARNVGPRWTPIFPLLGGIVLDGGSIGQHHSIIAREYGIPAIVCTGNATNRIQDGAWITVDGDTGLVEIVG